VCSVKEYWTRIRNIPLIFEKELGDGDAMLCRTSNGDPVRVTRPETLGSDAERLAVIEHYEAFYKKSGN